MSQQVYVAVTPSDTTIYAPALSKLYIGGTGTVAVLGSGDAATVTFTAVAVGWFNLPYPVSKVMATGTTATAIIGAATG